FSPQWGHFTSSLAMIFGLRLALGRISSLDRARCETRRSSSLQKIWRAEVYLVTLRFVEMTRPWGGDANAHRDSDAWDHLRSGRECRPANDLLCRQIVSRCRHQALAWAGKSPAYFRKHLQTCSPDFFYKIAF